MCSGVRSLTRSFLALAAVRSARVGGSRLARGTGFVASSPLGWGTLWALGPVGVWGLAQPRKGCSPWEESEVGNCSVGRDLALCEILAFGYWPGYFGCRGGVLLDEVSPVAGSRPG